MYISQNIADRIKRLMKVQKISNSQLADDIDNINVNTISQLSKGREISYVSFAKIADYLHCSVDYLLGRTDNPDINTNVRTGDVTGVNINGNTNTSVNIGSSKEQDITELVEMVQDLPLVKRAKVITYIDEIKKED